MKNNIILLNSAIMVHPGSYKFSLLSPEKFKELFLSAWDGKNLRSYIGYPNAKKMLEELLAGQVEIPLSRESTVFQSDHLILGCRLKYRVEPGSKSLNQAGQEIKDYEFFRIEYMP